MPVRFTGGPLDGRTLDHGQIDVLVVDCPMLSGNRDFVTVPAFDDWQRILSGKLSRDEATAYFTYERVSRNEIALEFRHVSDAEQWQAMGEAIASHFATSGTRARRISIAALLLGFGLSAIAAFVFVNPYPLMLVAVYAIYLPHFFLRDLPAEAGFQGPVSGSQLLLACGSFFVQSSLLCGDLAFWLASVLFAIGRFPAAGIAGGIALGLSAILYPLLSRPGLGQPSAVSTFVLRLVSMAMLTGTAWWGAR